MFELSSSYFCLYYSNAETQEEFMGPIAYALFAYGLTALISFAVIGVIVAIDRTMTWGSQAKKKKET